MSGIDEPVVQAVGWALLHFVWQGTLIAAIAAVALRALRDSAADVRYVVATVALSLMATMPVMTGVQTWRMLSAESIVVSESSLRDVAAPMAVSNSAQALSQLPAEAVSASVRADAGRPINRWIP